MSFEIFAEDMLRMLVVLQFENSEKTFISILMANNETDGCREHLACRSTGDRAALDIHSPQIDALAEAGIDFFKVETLPSFAEARGIAEAIEATGLPYVLSFVIGRDGCILDGTPLDVAI